MATEQKYWLYRWLDEFGIGTKSQVDKALNSPVAVRGLLETAREYSQNYVESLYPQISDAILAGSRADLSGFLHCAHYDCVRARIDETFPRMWHYFDKIVVDGCDVFRILNMAENGDWHSLKRLVSQEAQVLIYLRECAAEPFLQFTSKPTFCEEHFSKEAEALGLYSYFKKKDKTKAIAALIDGCEFEIEDSGDQRYWVSIHGPSLQEPYQRFFTGFARKPTKRYLAEQVIRAYSSALVSDVVQARYMSLPLGDTVDASLLTKKTLHDQISETDVALSLNLPVLNEISMKDFLKLREDERPYFEKFRTALKKAVREELASGTSASASQVAESVIVDVIKPELNDIECRMRTGRRALIKKTALNISVGASAVSVGMLDKMPLVLTAGIAAIGASLKFAHKQIDDQSAVELSDCYFLWQASKVASRK